MRDIARRALDSVTRHGALYADVRAVQRRERSAIVKAGRVEALGATESEGVGIRVLIDGAWGFASTGDMGGPAIDRAAALAIRIARASARSSRHPVELADRPPASGHYETPVEMDPFDVPLEQSVDLLLEAERAMARWAAENPPGKHGTHEYDLHEFRVDPGELKERLGSYCARFDVPCTGS